MALVKLEIDGKRIIADGNQTILQVARQHGIQTIPTLCDDAQLEPFASCFVCVVKVKGARSLVPACSTKVGNGMVVDTNSAEVRQSRKAALELLLSDHYADCVGPCQIACPAGIDIQGYIALAAIGKYKDAIALIKESNPLPSVCGRVCTRPCEVKGCRRTLLDEAVGIDYIKRYISDLDLNSADVYRPATAAPNGKKVAVVGAGPAGPVGGLLPGDQGLRRRDSRRAARAGRDAALRDSRVPAAQGRPRPGDGPDPRPRAEAAHQPDARQGLHGRPASRSRASTPSSSASARGAARSCACKNEDAAGVLSGIEFLKNFGLRKKIDIHGTVVRGRRRQHGHRLRADRPPAGRRRGEAALPADPRRDARQRRGDQRRDRGRRQDGVPRRADPGRDRRRTGRCAGLECQRMELGEPDASGRRSPKPVRGSEFLVPCDFVISAIGQSTTVSDLLDGRVPQLPPDGRDAQPHPVADRAGQREDVRDDGRRRVLGRRRRDRRGDGDRGDRGRAQGRLRHRHATSARGRRRPEPEEFVSRKDAFAKVTLEDLRSQEISAQAGHAARAGRRAGPELRRGRARATRRTTCAEEATRCLECGCVALFDCDLRKLRHRVRRGREALHGRGPAARARHVAPADRAGSQQVHPLRALRPDLQRRRRRVGLRLHQPRLQHRRRARARRVAARHRVRARAACASARARPARSASACRWPSRAPGRPSRARASATTAASGAGSTTTPSATPSSRCRATRTTRSPSATTAGRGASGSTTSRPTDRLRPAACVRAGSCRRAPVEDALGYAALRLRELTRQVLGRGDGRVRLAAADQRGDLPRAEVRADRAQDAQRDVVQPPGQPRAPSRPT